MVLPWALIIIDGRQNTYLISQDPKLDAFFIVTSVTTCGDQCNQMAALIFNFFGH